MVEPVVNRMAAASRAETGCGEGDRRAAEARKGFKSPPGRRRGRGGQLWCSEAPRQLAQCAHLGFGPDACRYLWLFAEHRNRLCGEVDRAHRFGDRCVRTRVANRGRKEGRDLVRDRGGGAVVEDGHLRSAPTRLPPRARCAPPRTGSRRPRRTSPRPGDSMPTTWSEAPRWRSWSCAPPRPASARPGRRRLMRGCWRRRPPRGWRARKELAARYPSQPPSLAARDEQADRVAAALEAWAGRPEVSVLDDRTAATIADELAALPSAPVGDSRPHASVTEALRALDLASESVSLLGERPPVPEGAGSETEVRALRELARRLRTPQLSAPPVPSPDGRFGAPDGPQPLDDRLCRGRTRRCWRPPSCSPRARPSRRPSCWGWAWRRARRRDPVTGRRIAGAGHRTPRRKPRLAAYRQALANAERERAEAVAEAARRGLAADPAAIDESRIEWPRLPAQAARASDWDARLATLRIRQAAAVARLRQALSDRGVVVANAEDPRQAADAYLAACETTSPGGGPRVARRCAAGRAGRPTGGGGGARDRAGPA